MILATKLYEIISNKAEEYIVGPGDLAMWIEFYHGLGPTDCVPCLSAIGVRRKVKWFRYQFFSHRRIIIASHYT